MHSLFHANIYFTKYLRIILFQNTCFLFLDNSQDWKLNFKYAFGFYDNLISENIFNILMCKFIKSKIALSSF